MRRGTLCVRLTVRVPPGDRHQAMRDTVRQAHCASPSVAPEGARHHSQHADRDQQPRCCKVMTKGERWAKRVHEMVGRPPSLDQDEAASSAVQWCHRRRLSHRQNRSLCWGHARRPWCAPSVASRLRRRARGAVRLVEGGVGCGVLVPQGRVRVGCAARVRGDMACVAVAAAARLEGRPGGRTGGAQNRCGGWWAWAGGSVLGAHLTRARCG